MIEKLKKTSDIYFASALLALGAKLENTNKDDPRHMEFEFSSTSTIQTGVLSNLTQLDLDDLESQWVNRTLTCNAFDFSEAIKRMKSIVHSS